MAAFPLSPAHVKIFYHSSKGSHTMTKPTREWIGEPWSAGGGSYARWSDDTLISAPTMIKAFVTLLLPLYTADVVFDSYIIYTNDGTDDAPDVPVFAELLVDQIGEFEDTVNHLAFAKTYSFLTESSHTSKIVLLDVTTSGFITKSGSVTGDDLALVNAHLAVTNAWAGRDDDRPVVFRSLNQSVNKALERKYNF